MKNMFNILHILEILITFTTKRGQRLTTAH